MAGFDSGELNMERRLNDQSSTSKRNTKEKKPAIKIQ
jgi:hypothetical protein